MARSLVPKGCIIHGIDLDGKGNAEVGYRCKDASGFYETGQKEYRRRVKGGEAISNYPRKKVKARVVFHRGISVSGRAGIGFTISPAHAVCRKERNEIHCTMKGDTSSASLSGARRRK